MHFQAKSERDAVRKEVETLNRTVMETRKVAGAACVELRAERDAVLKQRDELIDAFVEASIHNDLSSPYWKGFLAKVRQYKLD